MKITVEHTDEIDQSRAGQGRVWVGTTEKGTPVRALIAGISPASDDPVMIDRLEREYDEIPRIGPPLCPVCGEPMVPETHPEVMHAIPLELDLYVVAAHWIAGYTGTAVVTPAKDIREEVTASVSKEELGRLLEAARAAADYIGNTLAAQINILNEPAAGEA